MFLNIKKLRKEKKLTQQELADKIGVSVRMYSEYENETTDIGIKKLQYIAESLNCSILDLINVPTNYPAVKDVQIKGEPSHLEELLQFQKQVIADLKSDKEELKRDKALLNSLIETKLGNQEAS